MKGERQQVQMQDAVSTDGAEKTAVAAEPVLPLFPGLAASHIHVITGADQAEQAAQDLLQQAVIGFDTETRPVFQRGVQHTGPHLIQLATETDAYLIPVKDQNDPAIVDMLAQVLAHPDIIKAGFGLSDDLRSVRRKLGISVENALDLARLLRERKQSEVGAKKASAVYLGVDLPKSKRISTSDWSQFPLSEKQIQYAVNDALSALRIYLSWKRDGRKPVR